MQYIDVKEEFPFSVEKLFSYIEIHENLGNLFSPMSVKTIKKSSWNNEVFIYAKWF